MTRWESIAALLEAFLPYVPLVAALVAIAGLGLTLWRFWADARRAVRREAEEAAERALSLVLSTEVQRARATVNHAAGTDPFRWVKKPNGEPRFLRDRKDTAEVAEASLTLFWTIQQVHPLLARFHSKRLRTSAAIASIEHVYAVIGFMKVDLEETLSTWGLWFTYRDTLVETQKAIGRLPDVGQKPTQIVVSAVASDDAGARGETVRRANEERDLARLREDEREPGSLS
ncbi:hypothetical protein [Brachybacterium alimentarium]|uniref:hypothetical protein n=1 Tax=Brachybacterium alimentarium TaxID=47845 RepID=UPI000DF2A55E|nr:hypothetical protein [Brachybacterium alimentarium]RCS79825.1 hypothetical protein CIK67_17645 [Brachybacterium alimentarium]